MSQVCIGVCVYTEPERLYATLAQLQANTGERYELLLLGDGPEASVQQTLQRFEGTAQSNTEAAQGGAACFNRLARKSNADILILLESGVLVGPGWLDSLRHALATDPTHGLAGPSTNRTWGQQQVFPRAGGSDEEIACTAKEAHRRFGRSWQSFAPLYCLGDFCYAVRREVVDAIGLADETYALGPCWEIDYTVRAVRAGFNAVWAKSAYVYRHPCTARRLNEERNRFTINKHRFQDKFCGLRLTGRRQHFVDHCLGDDCPHFAPQPLIEIQSAHPQTLKSQRLGKSPVQGPSLVAQTLPLVSCIMPTHDRPEWLQQAVTYFLSQDYPHKELIIIDDGPTDLCDHLPDDPGVRYVHHGYRQSIGTKRNQASELAQGSIIAQWDDDDWYASDRLSRQVEPIRLGATDMTGLTDTTFFDLDRWQFWRCTSALQARLFYQSVAAGTLVYRRQVFEQLARSPDSSMAEDAEFLRRALRQGARLQCLPSDGMFLYLRHRGNTWRFQCGTYLDPTGWQRCNEPHALSHDREFYTAHSPETPPSLQAASIERVDDAPIMTTCTEDTRPLISCIMPTFNRRGFVPRAIKYFLEQDYPNRELVMFDDGTDSTEDLVVADARIRYHRLDQRLTLGAKRNAAIEASRGDIIVHWDDDDWMHAHRLSMQVSALRAAGADICGSSELMFYDLATDRLWVYRYPDTGRRWLAGSSLCYWRRLWQKKPFEAVNVGEDTQFVWAAPQGEMLDLKPFTHVVAMVHPGNTSAKGFSGPRWSQVAQRAAADIIGEDWAFYRTFQQACA